MIALSIIFFLLALNALFVAAEFAILASPRTALQKAAQQGSKRAKATLFIKENAMAQDRYIATCQLGITVASLGLGMYGEHQMAEWIIHGAEQVSWLHFLVAHSIASIASVTLLTYLHVVLGEMIPKTLALQTPLKMVLLISPLMRSFTWLMHPLVTILNGMGNGILALLGVQRTDQSHFSTIRDIQYIVHESHEAGMLEKDTADVLMELLDFTDMDASEMMVPRVHIAAIELGSNKESVRETIMTYSHSRYPVYKEGLDNIQGYVHLKDLYQKLRNPKVEFSLSEKELYPLPFVPATTKLETVLQAMHQDQVKIVILLDEFGGTAGLITLEDILSELIGPIDSKEIAAAEFQLESEGVWRVAGSMRLDDLSEELDLSLEHDEVETVGGLIMDILERAPEVGDQVDYLQLHFEVLQLQGRGVAECLISQRDLTDSESIE